MKTFQRRQWEETVTRASKTRRLNVLPQCAPSQSAALQCAARLSVSPNISKVFESKKFRVFEHEILHGKYECIAIIHYEIYQTYFSLFLSLSLYICTLLKYLSLYRYIHLVEHNPNIYFKSFSILQMYSFVSGGFWLVFSCLLGPFYWSFTFFCGGLGLWTHLC